MRRTFIAALLLSAVATLLASSTAAAPPAIRVETPDPVEATSVTGASITFHVKAYDPTSANPITATCSPPGTGGSGDFDVTGDFPIGPTGVTCTATLENGDTASESITVTVQDTTPPSIGEPSNTTVSTTSNQAVAVNYTPPTATDLGQEVPVVCTPPPGSLFPVGSSPVECTADDGRAPAPATKSFQVVVTLVDDEPPSFTTIPSPSSTEATGPGGALVTWAITAITAIDNLDPSPEISCTPPSGSTFPVGTTPVSCTATDEHGNVTPTPATFSVTVVDTTPPTLSLPPSQPLETQDPSGRTVEYTASASDLVAGSISPTCNPGSGSSFPVGTTTVNCTASDGTNTPATGSFTVTVVLVDHTAPTLHNVPGTTQREANGPLGSIVTYTPPTATDNLDSGPLLVNCNPPPGSTFPLGTTSVSCTATDSHLNNGVATFSVLVVDTTKPVLTPPGDRNIYATTPTGIPKDDPTVTVFLNGGTATDIVDTTLFIGNDAPGFLPVGTTIVTFVTADDSGNTDQGTAALTVFPMPPAGTTPAPLPQPSDRTPPDDVKNLKATAGSRKVTLGWSRPSAPDFDHVTVARSLADGSSASGVVYTGKATSYVDTSVQNGIEYRYTVVSFDEAGNRSAGVIVVALPRQLLLLTPRDGARVKSTKKSLKLSWARIKGADYYNAQLFFVPDLKALGLEPAKAQAEVKVLSVWPKKNTFILKRTWKFAGVRYRLRPGLYRWYVWPGYGSRKEVDYGPLMGSSTFVVVP